MLSDMRPDRGDPRQEPIYRWIRLLMAIDMLLGAGFAVFGLAIGERSFVVVGFGLAVLGAVLFLFFTLLAKRHVTNYRPPDA